MQRNHEGEQNNEYPLYKKQPAYKDIIGLILSHATETRSDPNKWKMKEKCIYEALYIKHQKQEKAKLMYKNLAKLFVISDLTHSRERT